MINKKPYIEIGTPDASCWEGWHEIGEEINRKISTIDQKKIVIAVECYQGAYADINLDELKTVISPNVTCHAKDIYKDEPEIRQQVKKDLAQQTAQRRATTTTIEHYFDENKLEALRNNIAFIEEGVILIHGIGALKIWEPNIVIYADMSKWEILQRFRRNDITNIGVVNEHDDFKHQYLWSYFIDWKVCDKIKRRLIGSCDYFLETNNWEKPKLATGEVVRQGLEMATRQPFFMAPFFDPQLWDPTNTTDQEENSEFSLAFNFNAEEDNLLFKLSDKLFEIPAINLIYSQPNSLLGEHTFKKYGLYLPIKLDFLDSSEGRNLILNINPGSDYIMDNYGLPYKQTTNFYVLDASSKSSLLLGLKEDISKEYFKETLINTSKTSIKEIGQALNKIGISKHEHIQIPSDTIHSNGHKCIILRISTAPSIFQYQLFKQLGKNQVELHHQAEKLIDNASLPHSELGFQNQKASFSPQPGLEEQLNAAEQTPISISRIWLDQEFLVEENDCIQVFNLIEGSEVQITSVDESFTPLVIHYSETFTVPASLKSYKVVPPTGEVIGLLKVSVKR